MTRPKIPPSHIKTPNPALEAVREAVLRNTPDPPDHARPPAPEQRRAADVEVVRVIGTGSMGEVCFARDHELMRDVAFKRLKRSEQTAELAARLEREARIGAQLDHPHIVPVHRLQRGPTGQLGYVMKLVQGEDFSKVLQRLKQRHADGKPFEADEDLAARLDVLRRIIDAVAYAHDKGVIHRDLKPSNILVGGRRQVYLTDWGLAKVLRSRSPLKTLTTVQTGASASEEPTSIGAMIGTVAYMSPEQANGRTEGLGAESDVFSLGIMLYEVLLLWHPYLGDDGQSRTHFLNDVRLGQLLPIDPRRGPEPVDEELLDIAARATAVRPEERYPNAGALADDLARYLAGEPIQASADTLSRRARRWFRRRPDLGVFAVVMLLVVDLAVLVYVLTS